MASLHDDVTTLHKIGSATKPKLARLGIKTIGDLLWHLPARYDDMREITQISNAPEDTIITIRGTIVSITTTRSFRKKLQITKAKIEDETGSAQVVWFGRQYVDKAVSEGDEVYISGKAKKDLSGIQFSNPLYEKVKAEQLHTAHIVPHYPLTEGLSQKQIRFLIQTALSSIETIEDVLPRYIIESEKFPSLLQAIKTVHRPEDMEALEHAMNRLKFDELFWTQLRARLAKEEYISHESKVFAICEDELKKFTAALPFTLTNDQRKAAWSILNDMKKNIPMNRLVQGDVGSGKTIVAALAIYNTLLNGSQAALMAPTELLAQQHYAEIHGYVESTAPTALLTSKKVLLNGKKASKKEVIDAIRTGGIGCVIGTHSIIQNDIAFRSLGLVIIDEQHRFGVAQRQRLTEINEEPEAPHLLSLTATPIPRTLALTLYGDLDISSIREKPKGRLPINTQLIEEKKRRDAYQFIRQEIQNGHQVFVMCPLIDESDSLETKSVLAEYKHLQEDVFPDLKLSFLHGKLKPEEKTKRLQDFKDKKFSLLVTTSVIEVGIDIPNATVMAIEGAERFGLAQLHQFRGRVGRSDLQSYCLLFSGTTKPETLQRLRLMTQYSDGFILAEKDLHLRGEGNVFGTAQSGITNFSVATIHDTELIEICKTYIDDILNNKKSKLTNTIKNTVKQLGSIHWE